MLELPTEAPLPPPSAMQKIWNMAQPGMRYVGMGMFAFLAYLIVLRPLKRRVMDSLTMGMSDEPGMVSSGAATGRAALTMPRTQALPGGDQSGMPRRLLDMERELDDKIADELDVASLNADAKKTAAVKKRIVDMAKTQPEQTAQLIRTMVTSHAE
jgi:flagellar biosynthesis/type III secretory pathway M-ring protein FliF/YscJ